MVGETTDVWLRGFDPRIEPEAALADVLGVVPEVASREHIARITSVVEQALAAVGARSLEPHRTLPSRLPILLCSPPCRILGQGVPENLTAPGDC